MEAHRPSKQGTVMDIFLNAALGYGTFLAVSAALLIIAIVIYVNVTPYKELTLIRQGNKSAAISLGGVVIGLALALKGASDNTVHLVELLIWGGVALISQLAAFGIACLFLRGIKQAIEEDKMSYAILLAAISVAVGLLNTGAISV